LIHSQKKMVLTLHKIDHGNNTPYQDTNLLPLPHQCTDHHAVPLHHGVPTHHGGTTLICPTRAFAATTLLPAVPLNTVNIWRLSGAAWDAAITIPAYLLTHNVMMAHVTLTADRIWTTPTAADFIGYLLQQLHEPLLGTAYWTLHLGCDGGNITPAPGAGCTFRGNTVATIAAATTRSVGVRLTDVRPGSEAYEIYWY